MKIMNRNVELAIKAVAFLRSQSGPVATRAIAMQVGSTINFIEQLMRKLRMAKIVNVKRGPGGGYFVNPAEEVSALSIAFAVGKDLTTSSSDMTPTGRISMGVTEAFKNVLV